MAATPFISLQEPFNIDGYNRSIPYSEQSAEFPSTFLDALEVRETVFVKEQGYSLMMEGDSDDGRSCHWVVYASVNTTTQPQKEDSDGNIIQRKQSTTKSLPIGTIRLVPFPHEPHPEPGSSWDVDESAEPKILQSSTPPHIVDRATDFHDGKEPYVKLGRIAVLKEFRGHGTASLLVNSALGWIQQNPTYFDRTLNDVSPSNVGEVKVEDIPPWNGLVIIHAQKSVVKAWERWGFQVDEKMGTWTEGGVPHVGMFRRLNVEREPLAARLEREPVTRLAF